MERPLQNNTTPLATTTSTRVLGWHCSAASQVASAPPEPFSCASARITQTPSQTSHGEPGEDEVEDGDGELPSRRGVRVRPSSPSSITPIAFLGGVSRPDLCTSPLRSMFAYKPHTLAVDLLYSRLIMPTPHFNAMHMASRSAETTQNLRLVHWSTRNTGARIPGPAGTGDRRHGNLAACDEFCERLATLTC